MMTAPDSTKKALTVLAGYLAASGVAALFGGYFTAKVTISTLYVSLAKPLWAPPGWMFGPVWSLLYISMGVAMWLVWKKRFALPAMQYAIAHACWWGQLALNAAWPVVFWLYPAGMAAFVVCALLAVCVWKCTTLFRPFSLPAAALMLSYALWVSFATVLSCTIWFLNRVD